MRARLLVPVGILVAAGAGSWATLARSPFLDTHDKLWYATHPVERRATMAWCSADVRNAKSDSCGNAIGGSLSPYRRD